MEDLDAVRAADGLVAEVHQRENISRNAGQTELLIRIAASCIGVHLVVGREDLTTKTDLVDQRRRESAIPVDHEVLERILAGKVRRQYVGSVAGCVDGVNLGVATHYVILGRCLPVDLDVTLIRVNIAAGGVVLLLLLLREERRTHNGRSYRAANRNLIVQVRSTGA